MAGYRTVNVLTELLDVTLSTMEHDSLTNNDLQNSIEEILYSQTK